MLKAPRSMRIHIGIFGRRNVGKSSLLNAITRQSVAIVSEFAGTTTDPVEKPMELLPLGPVLFIDTAGIDDEGALGRLRMEKTRQVFDRTDIGVLATDYSTWSAFEEGIVEELGARGIPMFVVFNKCDLGAPDPVNLKGLSSRKIRAVCVSALSGEGVASLRQALLESAPAQFIDDPAIAGDLVGPAEVAVLVIPIDKEAPKGRLILPQVQTIRDLLDSDALCMMVKERELRMAFEKLKGPPKLVITDSQAFLKVAADTPAGVPMTSFSILFARFKGDLLTQVEGALEVEKLRAGEWEKARNRKVQRRHRACIDSAGQRRYLFPGGNPRERSPPGSQPPCGTRHSPQHNQENHYPARGKISQRYAETLYLGQIMPLSSPPRPLRLRG